MRRPRTSISPGQFDRVLNRASICDVTCLSLDREIAGFVDPSVRERPSLELDLSVLSELQIPPPRPQPSSDEA